MPDPTPEQREEALGLVADDCLTNVARALAARDASIAHLESCLEKKFAHLTDERIAAWEEEETEWRASEARYMASIAKLERRLKTKAKHEREILALFEMQSEAMARQTDHVCWQHIRIKELEESVTWHRRNDDEYKRRCKTAYDNLSKAFDDKRISKKALEEALIELIEF